MADEIVTELKTKVLRKSKGAKVASGDYITVYYEGRFLDDQAFDANYDFSVHRPYPQVITAFQDQDNTYFRDTNEAYPFSFTIGAQQVIPGWDQGLAGRRIGEVVELTIPSDLAYGESGSGEVIPPNTPLEFTVELLASTPAATEENPSPAPFLLPTLNDFGIKSKSIGLKSKHLQRVRDTLIGLDGNDVLTGQNDVDFLVGLKGNDKLNGGGGGDLMIGGKGKDVYVYKNITDSLAFKGQRDTIFGFHKKDKINLKALNKDETFRFIESDKFSGVAGEVRFQKNSLQLDANGDGSAEFEILMPKTTRFTEANLIF